MKLRSISRARRVQFASAYVETTIRGKKLKEPDSTDEKSTESWRTPAKLLNDARLPVLSHINKWVPSIKQAADDIIADCLLEYYELPDNKKPTTRYEYFQFITEAAKKHSYRHFIESRKLHSYESPRFNSDGERVETVYLGVTRPTQENDCDAALVIKLIQKLPLQKRRMAERMIDGANIIECATELGLTPYNAMSEQRSVCEIMRRFFEDRAGDNAEATV